MEIALTILFWSGLSFIVTVESQLTGIAQTLMKAVTEPTQLCFFEVLKLSPDMDLAGRLTNFWHPDLPITEDMGCVLRCGMQRIELLDSEDRVNQDNLKALLTAHGAANDSTTKFIEMVADCRHKSKAVGCEMAAIMAECIRFNLYSWNWLPPYQEWTVEETGGNSFAPDKQKSVEKETGTDSLVPGKQESVEEETDGDSLVPGKQESVEEETDGDSLVPDKQESVEEETGGDSFIPDKQESVEEEKGGDSFVPDKQESAGKNTGEDSLVPDKQESVEEEIGESRSEKRQMEISWFLISSPPSDL